MLRRHVETSNIVLIHRHGVGCRSTNASRQSPRGVIRKSISWLLEFGSVAPGVDAWAVCQEHSKLGKAIGFPTAQAPGPMFQAPSEHCQSFPAAAMLPQKGVPHVP